jgi:hypothetical protein
MFRKTLALAALLGLAACSGSGLSTHQQIAISCETAASALDTLTAAKRAGKIDAEQLTDAVRIYEAGVIPLCVPVAEDMTAVQRAAFSAAIAELTRRAGSLR